MSSAKRSKQRKRLFLAPKHIRKKHLASPISDELVQKHGIRRLPLRTGDSVRVLRGDFVGLEGKVERVDYASGRVYVEGMAREKAMGVSSKLPVHASKVLITTLNSSDKWRSGVLAEKAKTA